jgi:hypothetical protein
LLLLFVGCACSNRAVVDQEMIDEINILQAAMLAMTQVSQVMAVMMQHHSRRTSCRLKWNPSGTPFRSKMFDSRCGGAFNGAIIIATQAMNEGVE